MLARPNNHQSRAGNDYSISSITGQREKKNEIICVRNYRFVGSGGRSSSPFAVMLWMCFVVVAASFSFFMLCIIVV